MAVRKAVAAAVIVMAGMPLLGCTTTQTLNTDNLAPAIEEVVGVAVTVTCPESIPIQKDLVTECTVSDGTQTKKLVVTQTDDQGNVDWEISEEAPSS